MWWRPVVCPQTPSCSIHSPSVQHRFPHIYISHPDLSFLPNSRHTPGISSCLSRTRPKQNRKLFLSSPSLVSLGPQAESLSKKKILWAQIAKNLPARQADPGSIPGSGISPEEGNPPQDSSLENFLDRQSLTAYSQGLQRVVHNGVTNTFTFKVNLRY